MTICGKLWNIMGIMRQGLQGPLCGGLVSFLITCMVSLKQPERGLKPYVELQDVRFPAEK